MSALKEKLIEMYEEDDAEFAEKAMKMIDDHYSQMPKSTSKIDPERFGPRSTFTSRLKMALIEKVGPVEVDGHPKFNELDVKEQIKFQKRAIESGLEDWVHSVQIIPDNLEGIKMPDKSSARLKEMRADIDNGKLEAEMTEIDADRMLAKVCPILLQQNPKRHHLATAVLAVTGRRTVEVLKLGKLYLGPDQTPDGYTCWFDGQAKQGVNPTKAYVIPLLAPFSLVKAALTKVRQLYSTEDISTESVNSILSKSINNYCKKVVGVSPHGLRTIYAMCTYQLLGKKMSLIGHIRKYLGHSTGSSAASYQRMSVSITKPWSYDGDLPEEDISDEEAISEWVLNGAVEKKRFEGIREMMNARQRLTPTAIRAKVGGTIAVLTRILEKNAALVDEYNNSLTEEETKRIRRN